GLARQLGHCRGGAFDRSLAVHLGIEEPCEIAPLFLVIERGVTAAAAERLRERIAVEHEVDRVRLAQPVAEVANHVEQHLVAVGNNQWSVHGASLSRIAARSAGASPSDSAAARRSGSCAQRKSSTAR